MIFDCRVWYLVKFKPVCERVEVKVDTVRLQMKI